MTDNNLYSLGLESDDRVTSTLGGGIPKSSICLLEGDTGGGKSVWTQRFASGFADGGASVCYITAEYRADGFVKQMRSLGYPVLDFMVHGDLLFFRADTEAESYAGRPAPLDALEQSPVIWDSDVVIIDDFDILVRLTADLTGKDEELVISEFMNFLDDITLVGTTVVLAVNSTLLDDASANKIRAKSSLFFRIEMEKVAGNVRRGMSVVRYSQMQEQVDSTISYSVQPRIGIIIETRTVA
jgi:flagellar protein FlaH